MLIASLGFIKIFNGYKATLDKVNFCTEYNNTLINLIEARGNHAEKYAWLINKSTKMQRHLGRMGLIQYKPPHANYMHNNYPVIMNLVPEMHSAFQQRSSWAQDLAQLVTNCINMHHGSISEILESKTDDLKNPMTWFREGIGTLTSSPVLILRYLNIIPNGSLTDIENGKLYKAITGLTILITGVVALIVKWRELIEIFN